MEVQTLEAARVEFTNYKQQLEHEIALLKRVPEMGKQRQQAEARLAVVNKRLIAINSGFSPYRPPMNGTWHTGFLSKPSGVRTDYRLYKRALPLHVIEAYTKAKNTKLFKHITVHSPDPEAFMGVPVRIRSIDPVMVGWLTGDVGAIWQETYATIIGTEIGDSYLIAEWDLAKDLAFNPELLLTEGSE